MINRNRTCIKCSEEFQLKPTDKSSNICGKCKASYQRAYARRKVAEIPEDERYKEKYPYGESKKLRRFTELRQTLDKMSNRKEWQSYFKERLEHLEENEKELLIWIFDRRDQESRLAIDRKPQKKHSYEDTRSTKQNDKSWFD
jgi:PHP family Zn ribbon phosphoesterase